MDFKTAANLLLIRLMAPTTRELYLLVHTYYASVETRPRVCVFSALAVSR